jgi:hypothetical protein
MRIENYGGRMIRNRIIRYWGRKPVELARTFINLYSHPREIIADTFGGSGTFIAVALELGRRGIYVDLNPFAKLIAHSMIEGCDSSAYMKAIKRILSRRRIKVIVNNREIKLEPRKLFHVRCACRRSIEAKSVTFTRVYRLEPNNYNELNGLPGRILKTISGYEEITHDMLCKIYRNIPMQTLSSAVKRFVREGLLRERAVPVGASLIKPCKCGRVKINFKEEDIWIIKGSVEPAYWYPEDSLKYKNGKPFLKKRDVLRVNELFMKRSLALLSAIWHDICRLKVDKRTKRCLKLTFMATLARSSKMCRQSGGTWPINSYWIPRNFVIRNPYMVFENASNQMLCFLNRRKPVTCGNIAEVLHQKADVSFLMADSTKINLPKNSIDYVIIDPPHTDEAQFFELSLFYTSWMKEELQFENELIINSKQGKNLKIYLQMLRDASERIMYYLKPGKFFTTILHEEDPNILTKCVETIRQVGFKLIQNDKEGNYRIYTFRKPGRIELFISKFRTFASTNPSHKILGKFKF